MSRLANHYEYENKETAPLPPTPPSHTGAQLIFYFFTLVILLISGFSAPLVARDYLILKFGKELGVYSASPFTKLGFAILTALLSVLVAPLIGLLLALIFIHFAAKHLPFFKPTPHKLKITILSFIHCLILLFLYLLTFAQS